MERRMMSLENRGDRRQHAITFPQPGDRGNGEMFPGNQSQRGGCERAKDLRDQDNSLSTESIRQMAGG